MALNLGKILAGGTTYSYGNQSPAVDAVPLAWTLPAFRYNVDPAGSVNPALAGIYGWQLTAAPNTWVAVTFLRSPTDVLVFSQNYFFKPGYTNSINPAGGIVSTTATYAPGQNYYMGSDGMDAILSPEGFGSGPNGIVTGDRIDKISVGYNIGASVPNAPGDSFRIDAWRSKTGDGDGISLANAAGLIVPNRSVLAVDKAAPAGGAFAAGNNIVCTISFTAAGGGTFFGSATVLGWKTVT
jgi:hypothetical protein